LKAHDMSGEDEREDLEEGKPEDQGDGQGNAPVEQPEGSSEGSPAEKPEEKPKKRARKKPEAKKPEAKKPKTKKPKAKKAEAPEEGVIAKGDFLLVEMTGRAVETDDVFDTTEEELAKQKGIHGEGKTYGPRLVVVGEGWVLKGLDERLAGLKVDEKAEVEIPPGEAFGERSAENVRTVPFRFLRSKGLNPTVGAQVEVDGRTAVVRSVGAGRVQLDYNHPLAGRKIAYEVKATKRYEGDEEKVRALIGRRFLGVDLGKFDIKILKKKARIQIPEEVFFGENIQIAKRGVALDIQRFFPDVEEVEYTEVIKRSA